MKHWKQCYTTLKIMRYFGAKTILSIFTWNGSTPLFPQSSFLIGSETILYYLRNVSIVNKVSQKPDLDSPLCLVIIMPVLYLTQALSMCLLMYLCLILWLCLCLYFSSLTHNQYKLECLLQGKSNRREHIRHQCRKTTVLSCHRCLINTDAEKMNKI